MYGETLSALALEQVRTSQRMADLGTGAGFPGLALAIALADTQVALVENDPKKSGFLREVSGVLGLTNVEVVGLPLQSWTEGVGTCDLVTSRRVWAGGHHLGASGTTAGRRGGDRSVWEGV